jgi:hypothetical protein
MFGFAIPVHALLPPFAFSVYSIDDMHACCRVPFPSSSPWIMLLFYWLSSAALVAFSYAISTMFSSTRVASLFCPLIYLLAMVPAFLAVYSQVSTLHSRVCALI